jgi:hypothetical protein
VTDSGPGTVRAIAPRPTPDPAVLAAIAAATEQVVAPGVPAASPARQHLAWRFSGRWWNKPTPMVRERPVRAALGTLAAPQLDPSNITSASEAASGTRAGSR